MEGYIRLHRKIIHNPIFNDFQLYRLWNLCLLNASYKEREILIDGQIVKVYPGQWIVGRFSLFDTYNNGLSPKDKVKGEKTPYRWLEKLEKLGYLTLEKTNKFTVINIVNWRIYQHDGPENDQQVDHQMTIKRPSNDHQMTTNKKDKKGLKVLKEDNNNSLSQNPYTFYLQNIQKRGFVISPYDSDKIQHMEIEYGLDLVMAAMEVTAKNGKDNIAYVESVLNRWQVDGVKTVADANNYKFGNTTVKTGTHKKSNVIDWEALANE